MPRRRLFRTDSWEYGHDNPAAERPLAPPKKRRAATMLAYAAMFFAGAAFAAVAGDRVTQMTAADGTATATDSTTTDATATDAATAAPDATAATADASTSDAAPAGSDPAAATDQADALARGSASPASSNDAAAPAAQSAPSAARVAAPASKKTARVAHLPTHVFLLPAPRPAPAPEIEGPVQYATIWLNRPLPDPTPPALRLARRFARNLQSVSRSDGVDWALVLGVLRAQGATGHVPARAALVQELAARLASLAQDDGNEWSVALAYGGDPAFADKATALARYDRAVGLGALVNGLESAKTSLGQRLLDDPAIDIYPGGRDDIANGKVDVRVLALISYLHQCFGEVAVSSLVSGHRLYARPGVISAHVYGRAVDIAALGGTTILGHQEVGGVTEQAVRDILLLPDEVMPKQVISLLGLGGPSFPLADHYNHIHVGF